VLDREPFVAALLAGYGEYPSYYAHMAERNRRPRPPAYRDPVPEVAACELGGLDDRTWVLDVRPRACFAAGHAPGSVAAGLDGPFATYVGWTMPWGTPFALVGADEAELWAARRALAHIGLDVPVTTAVLRESDCSSQLRRATFAELAAVPDGEVTVVDVRRHQEWEASHLAGSVHVPLHALLDTPLPPGPLWLHCAAGYRAVFGASLLRRRGAEVVAVDDSWSQAEPAGLAVVSAAAA
jgi:rhodanese-related sulfurtransferase